MKIFLIILLILLSPLIMLLFLILLLWPFKYNIILKRENGIFEFKSNLKPKKEKKEKKKKSSTKSKIPNKKKEKNPIKKNIIKTITNIKKNYNNSNKKYNFKAIIKHTKILFERIIKYAAPKKINGDIILGFKYPHQTGQALAFIYPIWNLIPNNEVELYGNFEKEEFSFYIHIYGKFFVWQIAIPLIKYIFTKEIKFLIKSLLKNRRK